MHNRHTDLNDTLVGVLVIALTVLIPGMPNTVGNLFGRLFGWKTSINT